MGTKHSLEAIAGQIITLSELVIGQVYAARRMSHFRHYLFCVGCGSRAGRTVRRQWIR